MAGGGGGVALIGRGGSWSHAQLASAVGGLAARLAAVSPGPVLVYGHMEPEVVAALLACDRLGRPAVPVDTAYPAARAAEIADLAAVTAAVCASEPPALLVSALRARRAALVAPALAVEPVGPPPQAGGDPVAYVMFTSGSSGRPKGVPVRRGAVRHFCRWCRGIGAPAGEGPQVVLGQAPFSFDLSVMGLCLAVGGGGALVLLDREQVADGRALHRALAASGITVWVSTPSFARLCLAEPGFGAATLPRLRRFLFCGEILPAVVAAALLQRFPGAEVWNTYGPTEATVAVTALRVSPELAAAGGPLPVGRPVPGMRVWVTEPRSAEPWRALPEEEEGEIVIAGPQVGPGYLPGTGGEQPGFLDLPPEAGGGTAYRTGDLGVSRGGLLYCLGRLDRQMKLHGYRLEPEEIEHHLRRLPGVADAVVTIARRRGEPDHLVAFVATSADGDAAAWRAELGERLPPYAVPRVIRPVRAERWPLTPNGKVDRAALERMLP